jgi:hypothetical protein
MSYRTGLARLAGRRLLARPIQLSLLRPAFTFTHAQLLSSTVTDGRPKTPESFIEKFRKQNRASTKLEFIHTFLSEVKDAYVKSGNTTPAFNTQDAEEILQTICSDKYVSFKMLKEAVISLQDDFRIPITLDTHSAILRALIAHSQRAVAGQWVRDMGSCPPFQNAPLEFYHQLFSSDFCSYSFAHRYIPIMRARGIHPTWETYTRLIQIVWRDHPVGSSSPPDPRTFEWMIRSALIKNRLPYNPSFGDEIYEGFLARDLQDVGEKLYELYTSHASLNPSQGVTLRVMSILRDAANSGGFQAAIREWNALAEAGARPDKYILSALIRHSVSIAELQAAEEILGVSATVVHYSTLIGNNARRKNLSNALAIYRHARDRGIVPNSATVHPLLHGLCFKSTVTEESLDQALDIYRDLVSTFDDQLDDGHNFPKLTSKIYSTLISALTLAQNHTKYAPVIESLFQDAKRYNISSFALAKALILDFMVSASTAEEAIALYRRFNKQLDAFGYARVLKVFQGMTYGGSTVPSFTHYLQIISDMREAGFDIEPRFYTKALQTIVSRARETKDSDVLEELAQAIVKIHDHMTLDASCKPDTWFYNDLLSAYSFLSMHADAFRVWDQMYLSGMYNHVSVSVVLDACGYSGSWSRTRAVAKRLAESGFVFNYNNWHAWLECLCRLGRLDDAVKIVCLHMGEGPNGVQPDEKTVRLLLSWTRTQGLKDEVMRRIHKYKPQLWATLPENMTTQ